MTRYFRFCSWLAVVALTGTVVAQPGATQQAPATTANGSATTKPAPAGPTPKSPEELAALKAVAGAAQNPASTPPQVDGAIQDLLTKFPQTEFKEWAYTMGLNYHYHRGDYAGTLEYGEDALKTDSRALLPLLILASVIPEKVQPTDLDRDQRLAQAEGYDRTALDYADHFPTTVNGHPLTPQQIGSYQQTIRSTAHSSLGLIASDRQQYAQAAQEFQQAIPLEAPPNQAHDYYRMGEAQENLKDYKDALASMNKALQLGAGDDALQTLATAEKEKITREMPAAPAAAAPATPHR